MRCARRSRVYRCPLQVGAASGGPARPREGGALCARLSQTVRGVLPPRRSSRCVPHGPSAMAPRRSLNPASQEAVMSSSRKHTPQQDTSTGTRQADAHTSFHPVPSPTASGSRVVPTQAVPATRPSKSKSKSKPKSTSQSTSKPKRTATAPTTSPASSESQDHEQPDDRDRNQRLTKALAARAARDPRARHREGVTAIEPEEDGVSEDDSDDSEAANVAASSESDIEGRPEPLDR